MHALMTFMQHRVRTEPVMKAEVIALADKVIVQRAQHRPEEIGIHHLPAAACVGGTVAERHVAFERHGSLEETGRVTALDLAEAPPVRAGDVEPIRPGHEGAHHPVLSGAVQAQHAERVSMPS